MRKQTLNGQWRMRATGEENWIKATVPGSVYCDLLSAGKLEDPYYRDNDVEALKVAEKDYEYAREFDVDADMLANDRVYLVFYGLDTLASIYVNHRLVASTDDMHRTYEFDVKQFVRQGRNEIRIVFASALNFIREMERKDPFDTHNTCATRGFPHIRKAHNMFGWDSEPELPDTGIWRDVELIGWSTARLDTLYVRQAHENGRVTLTVELPVEAEKPCPLTCSVTLTAPDGSVVQAQGDVSGNQARVCLAVDDPQLWWPNGYGAQNLYALRAELTAQGLRLDCQEKTIGLRTMRVRREKDQWGESFEIEVNGVGIFAKGADYIPLDKFLPRETNERIEKLFKDCVSVHHNCMRIWGGAIFPSDTFFDLADRYGVLIWQDFMFACALYRQTPEFEANVIAESRDNVKRLRHHACLALWCGNNENEWLMDMWNHDKTAAKRRDYIRLSEIVLKDVVDAYDPDRLYFPSSPSSDGFFNDANGGEAGDMHCWDVWHNAIKPYTGYAEYPSRFTSEFGLQSFPCMKTVEAFTLPEDRSACSYIMDHHQRNGNGYGNAHILYYVLQDLPYPETFEKVVYASQVVQSEAVRFGAEYWRRIRGRCMGVLYWQADDCWPAPTWASIDYAGRWKALHYRSRHFYAPTLVSIEAQGDALNLYVVSDLMQDKAYELNWTLKNARSEVIKGGRQAVAAPKLASTMVLALSTEALLQGQNPRDVYLEVSLSEAGVQISANNYLFVKPKHFRFADPAFQVKVKDAGDAFVLSLTSAAFARYVYLDFEGFDCQLSDNHFDMSAGEKEIRILKEDAPMGIAARELTSALRIMSVADLF